MRPFRRIRATTARIEFAMKRAPQKRTRVVGLDVLRCVAVLLVLGAHLRDIPVARYSLIALWKTGGWVGVDIFFVLSGFLVSRLLFEEYVRHGAINVRRFLLRRAWKIYPSFWLLTLFTVTVPPMFQSAKALSWSLSPVFAELGFVQNYIRGLWGHTWTLAVEEHFYIVVALFLSVLASRGVVNNPFASVPTTFVLLAIVCMALRVTTVWAYRSQPDDWFVYCGTHMRIDSLFYGTLLAYWAQFCRLTARLRRLSASFLVGGGAACLLPAFFVSMSENRWCWPVIVVLLYGGAGLWVLAARRLRSASNLFVLGISKIGAASYSIYLWHGAVNGYGTRAVEKLFGVTDPWLYLVTYVTGSVVVGLLMHGIVEKPLLAIRDKQKVRGLFPV